MVNSNWKEKELPHHLVPLPEFHCFVFAEGGRGGWGGGGHEHTDVRPSTEDQCTLFTASLFAYYRANASHEHRQFGYSYYRQKNNLMPR